MQIHLFTFTEEIFTWNLRLMHWVNRRYRNSSNSAPFKEKMTLYKSCLPNTANKGRSTVNYRHIYHLMIIVTGGFSKKSFFIIFRTSHTQMSLKTGVSRNFAIFTGKHVLDSLFNKLACFTACNFISTSSQNLCWSLTGGSCEKCKNFYEQHFFYGTSRVAAFVSLIK